MSGSDRGPAATVASGGSGLIRAFVRSPLDPTAWRAALAILLGSIVATVSFAILSACFSAGGSMLLWLVGIPIIGLGIEASRVFARVERWRIRYVDHRPLEAHPYRAVGWAPQRPYGPWLRGWAEGLFLDVDRWRDVVYILILLPAAMIELSILIGLWATAAGLVLSPLVLAALRDAGVEPLVGGIPTGLAVASGVAVLLGLLLVPVAASAARGLMILHRALVEGLLCVSPTEALRQDVERLRGSRSAALELEASELRRIERDLHDGAQQRLVRLAIDLGRAEERIETDPAMARSLVAGAREQARQALSELRDLVRGTAPAILLDRGLVAALDAVAGSSPVPTVLESDLGSGVRLPPAVERAAYFVVAEALANVAKHSGAGRCEIHLGRAPRSLIVEVRDDGTGGATMVVGGGLAGLRDRVGALDGSLSVSSPPGGPTVVRVELPVATA